MPIDRRETAAHDNIYIDCLITMLQRCINRVLFFQRSALLAQLLARLLSCWLSYCRSCYLTDSVVVLRDKLLCQLLPYWVSYWIICCLADSVTGSVTVFLAQFLSYWVSYRLSCSFTGSVTRKVADLIGQLLPQLMSYWLSYWASEVKFFNISSPWFST